MVVVCLPVYLFLLACYLTGGDATENATTAPVTTTPLITTPRPIVKLSDFSVNQSSSTVSSVLISWLSPTNAGTANITYSVSCGSASAAVDTMELQFNCTGMTSGQVYNASVVAKVVGDVSYQDSDAQWTSAKTLLSPVSTVGIESANESCITATWAASVTAGVTYYLVDTGGEKSSAGNTLSKTLCNLSSGENVTFSVVVAKTGFADSPASPRYTARTLVSPVKLVNVTAVNETCVAAEWTTSSTVNAFYFLVLSDGKTINTGSNLYGSICGLLSGQLYSMYVAAAKIGFDNSTNSNRVSTKTLVSPVTSVLASTITEKCVTVEWTKSTTVDAFYYLMCSRCTGLSNDSTTNLSRNVCGLNSGEEYTFQVITGKTDFRNSSPSSVNVKTRVSPVAFVNVSSINETCINAQWPQSSTSNVTYSFTCPSGPKTNAESSRSALCCSLSPGENYHVSVVVNKATFPDSDVTQGTGQTVVSPTGDVTATGANESCITAWWMASKTADATYYIVSQGGQQAFAGNSLTGSLCGLQSGENHTLSIVVGKSGFANSTKFTAVTAQTYVSPVASVTAKASNETCLDVSWTASRTSAVTYNLTCGSDPAISMGANLTGSCCGLAAGETYTISVVVLKTAFRDSTAYGIKKQTQMRSVDASTVVWNSTSSGLLVTWQPSSNSSGVQYQVCVNDTCASSSADSNASFANLTAGTAYEVQIRATRPDFPKSQPTSVMILTRPGPVTQDNLAVKCVKNNHLDLTYTRSDSDSGTDGLHVEVLSARNTAALLWRGNLTMSELPSLTLLTDCPFSDNLTVSVWAYASKAGLQTFSSASVVRQVVTAPKPPAVAWKLKDSRIEVNATAQTASTLLQVNLRNGTGNEVRTLSCDPRHGELGTCLFTFDNLQPGANFTCVAWAAYFTQQSLTVSLFGATTVPDPRHPQLTIIIGIPVASACAVILLVSAVLVVRFIQRKRRHGIDKRTAAEWRVKPGPESEIPIVMQASWMSDGTMRDVSIEDFHRYVNFMLRDSELEVQRQFEELRENSKLREQECYTFNAAMADCNRAKNRYTDILPYDHTRVMLESSYEGQGFPPDDYINANYIKGLDREREFIACQGPLPGTVDDHWRMIYEHKVALIVTLTQCMEGPKKKCEPFWPAEVGKSENYDEIKVLLESESTLETYTVRIMQVTCTTDRNQKVPLRVVQLYYLGWPDFGVPNVDDLAEFLRIMRTFSTRAGAKDCEPPIVVHCSAGVGRTGTLIALDIVTRLLEQKRITSINVYETVMELRSCRKLMVQSKGQLAFIYRFLLHYLNKRGFLKAGPDANDDAASMYSGTYNPGFHMAEVTWQGRSAQ